MRAIKARLIHKAQRGEKISSNLQPDTILEAAIYLEQYRRMWQSRYSTLDSLLKKEHDMVQPKVTKDPKNKTLTIECTFDAPKEKLWRAYADKAWFEKWWGPEGWQTTTKTFEFKPGGKIHYVMECVDKNQGEWFGQKSWGLMIIESLDKPNRFEAQDRFSNEAGTIEEHMPTQKFVVELIEENGKTRLITRSISDTAEALEELVKMGMVEGFSSQLNRLENLLAS